MDNVDGGWGPQFYGARCVGAVVPRHAFQAGQKGDESMRFDGRVDALEQFVICQFHEDWLNDVDDAWQSAEASIQRCSLENLAAVAQQIAVVNELLPTSFERYTTFDLGWAFATPEEFDRWLGAVQRRIAQVLAGDDGEPLVAPA